MREVHLIILHYKIGLIAFSFLFALKWGVTQLGEFNRNEIMTARNEFVTSSLYAHERKNFFDYPDDPPGSHRKKKN